MILTHHKYFVKLSYASTTWTRGKKSKSKGKMFAKRLPSLPELMLTALFSCVSTILD